MPSILSNDFYYVSCKTYGINYVSSMSKPVSTRPICKPVRILSFNKPVLFTPKSLCASDISMKKPFHSSIRSKPVSALISSEHSKSCV